MHPRNPYRNPPDFNSLADSYVKLKPYLVLDPKSRRTTIDFQDEEAQRRLTEAIMHRDFNINLHIPLTRLCPPVPNRMNYALWIQDLVRAHKDVLGPSSRPIRGIDIGTGATAIYPFIVCKLEPTWEMIATELDEESCKSALSNVAENKMDSRIHVRKASANGEILFPLEDQPHDKFEFTMCNPPFYANADEVAQSAQDKERPPNAVCTGADIEMIYANGGEEGFAGKILEESTRFQTRCKWYTSMLGKMSSVSTIVERIRQLSITNYAVTEFVQGQTRRWAIAWSFTDSRLPDAISRISHIGATHALYSSMPPKNTLVQPFAGHGNQEVSSALLSILESMEKVTSTPVNPPSNINSDGSNRVEASLLPPSHHPEPLAKLFLVEAQGNTWSRSARRSRKRGTGVSSPSSPSPSPSVSASASTPTSNPGVLDSKPALTCSCRVLRGISGPSLLSDELKLGVVEEDPQSQSQSQTRTQTQTCVVEFQWIFGEDRTLFESFVGHVSRKVAAALRAGD